MSKAKHTPGPWNVSIYETPKNRTNPVQVTVIATGVSIRVNGYRQEANAHLIAAAPDLLAACETAREWIGPSPDDSEWGEYYSKLRDVIAALDKAIAAAKAGES